MDGENSFPLSKGHFEDDQTDVTLQSLFPEEDILYTPLTEQRKVLVNVQQIVGLAEKYPDRLGKLASILNQEIANIKSTITNFEYMKTQNPDKNWDARIAVQRKLLGQLMNGLRLLRPSLERTENQQRATIEMLQAKYGEASTIKISSDDDRETADEKLAIVDHHQLQVLLSGINPDRS